MGISVSRKYGSRKNSSYESEIAVFTRISAPLNKRGVWDKKFNNRRTRISKAAPMRRLFEVFRITKIPLQIKSKTALEASFLPNK